VAFTNQIKAPGLTVQSQIETDPPDHLPSGAVGTHTLLVSNYDTSDVIVSLRSECRRPGSVRFGAEETEDWCVDPTPVNSIRRLANARPATFKSPMGNSATVPDPPGGNNAIEVSATEHDPVLKPKQLGACAHLIPC